MAERSKAAVLKTVEGNTSGGSNPSLPATTPKGTMCNNSMRLAMKHSPPSPRFIPSCKPPCAPASLSFNCATKRTQIARLPLLVPSSPLCAANTTRVSCSTTAMSSRLGSMLACILAKTRFTSSTQASRRRCPILAFHAMIRLRMRNKQRRLARTMSRLAAALIPPQSPRLCAPRSRFLSRHCRLGFHYARLAESHPRMQNFSKMPIYLL